MKISSFVGVLAGCVALGAFHSGFAQETITGTIGGGTPSAEVIRANVNHVALNISGLLKFKFQAVTTDAKAGVPYVMNFCIGPAKNPCGLPTDIVYAVPGGTAVFALLDASVFADGNIMTVSVGTAASVEYEITLE